MENKSNLSILLVDDEPFDLKLAITSGENGFEALMEAVRHCSLGQLTDAFFEVGGQYRRST